MTAWSEHHLLPQLTLPPPGYRVAPGHLDVWTLHTNPDTADRVHRLKALLNTAEHHRANSFLNPDRRDTYLLAHLALRLVLANCLGTTPPAVAISRARCPACRKTHGRPTLQHTRNLHFSLSHTRTTVMLALARTPVGIDLEAVDRVDSALLRRLHPNEQEAVHRLPRQYRPHALLECWVRKDAYLKGRGTDLAADQLHTVDIGPGGEFGHGTDPAGWQLTKLAAPPGYAAAAALNTGRQPTDAQVNIAHHGCESCSRPAGPTPAATTPPVQPVDSDDAGR